VPWTGTSCDGSSLIGRTLVSGQQNGPVAFERDDDSIELRFAVRRNVEANVAGPHDAPLSLILAIGRTNPLDRLVLGERSRLGHRPMFTQTRERSDRQLTMCATGSRRCSSRCA
jgi:hypothetical protein